MEVSKTATSTPTEQTRRYRHADIDIMGETHFACDVGLTTDTLELQGISTISYT